MKRQTHRIVYDQKERAGKIAKARKKGMTLLAATEKYGGGASRVTVYLWLKKYTDYYKRA